MAIPLEKNLFVSFSGDDAEAIAQKLVVFLGRVIQEIKPWISRDIKHGAMWPVEIRKALLQVRAGIIVLTPRNLESPWCLFEAGALSTGIDAENRPVIPLAFGVEKGAIGFPLGMLQAAASDEAGLLEMCQTLRTEFAPTIKDEDLKWVFEKAYPEFRSQFEAILSKSPVPRRAPDMAKMIEETREMVLSLQMGAPWRKNIAVTMVADKQVRAAFGHLAVPLSSYSRAEGGATLHFDISWKNCTPLLQNAIKAGMLALGEKEVTAIFLDQLLHLQGEAFTEMWVVA